MGKSGVECVTGCLNYTETWLGVSLFIERKGARNCRRFEFRRSEQKYYRFRTPASWRKAGERSLGVFLFLLLNMFYFNRFWYALHRGTAFLCWGPLPNRWLSLRAMMWLFLLVLFFCCEFNVCIFFSVDNTARRWRKFNSSFARKSLL